MLAGTDAILLGAETLRGLYPIETISTVGRICSEVGHLLSSTSCSDNSTVLLALYTYLYGSL